MASLAHLTRGLPPLQQITLGKFRIAYRANLTGRGEPLLFVHGLGSSHLVWARALPLLGRPYVAVDLPGYGESDKPRYGYTLPFYMRRLTRLLDALCIEQATWVGHSMGAQIAVLAALEAPARVRALRLFSPAGFETFDASQADVLRALTTVGKVRNARRAQVENAMTMGFFRRPAEADALVARRMAFQGAELDGYAHAFSRSVRAMLEAPVLHRLSELEARTPTVPMSIRLGAEDQLVPSRLFGAASPATLLESIRDELPDAEAALVPEAGHLLPFERPEIVAELLA